MKLKVRVLTEDGKDPRRVRAGLKAQKTLEARLGVEGVKKLRQQAGAKGGRISKR